MNFSKDTSLQQIEEDKASRNSPEVLRSQFSADGVSPLSTVNDEEYHSDMHKLNLEVDLLDGIHLSGLDAQGTNGGNSALAEDATETRVNTNKADAQIIGGSTKVEAKLVGSSNIADSSSGIFSPNLVQVATDVDSRNRVSAMAGTHSAGGNSAPIEDATQTHLLIPNNNKTGGSTMDEAEVIGTPADVVHNELVSVGNGEFMVQPILFVNKVAQNESQSQPKQSLFSDGEDDTLADFFDPNEAAAARNDGESTDTAAAGNPASAVATQTLVVANNADAQIIGGSTKVKTELGSSNIADSSSGTQMISPPNGGSTGQDAPESVDSECVPESTVKAMQTFPWLHSTLESIKKNRGVILTSVGVLAMAILAAQSMPELTAKFANIAGMTSAAIPNVVAGDLVKSILADPSMSSALVPYSDVIRRGALDPISTGMTLGAFMLGLPSLIGVSATSAWAWLEHNGACARRSSLVTPFGSGRQLHGTDKQVVSRILPDPKGRADQLVVAVSQNAAVKDIGRIGMSLLRPPYTHAVLMMNGAAYFVSDGAQLRKLSKPEIKFLKSSLGAKKNLVLSPDGKIAVGNTGERILVAQLVTDDLKPRLITLLDDVVANTLAEYSHAKIVDTAGMTTSDQLRDLCQNSETDTVFVTETQILYFAKGSPNLVVSARGEVSSVHVVVLTTRGKDGLIHMLNSEAFFVPTIVTTTNALPSGFIGTPSNNLLLSLTKAQHGIDFSDSTTGVSMSPSLTPVDTVLSVPEGSTEEDIFTRVNLVIENMYGGAMVLVDNGLYYISPTSGRDPIRVDKTHPLWAPVHDRQQVVILRNGNIFVGTVEDNPGSKPVLALSLVSASTGKLLRLV